MTLESDLANAKWKSVQRPPAEHEETRWGGTVLVINTER